MAGRAVSEILAPEVIKEVISRIDLPGTTLQRLFGWNIGGGNTTPHDFREGAYDIFDVTRTVATGRVPGAPNSRQKPQKVGKVRFTLPRAAEEIPLDDEKIHNQRDLGGPATPDRGGRNYIANQQEYLAQRFANLLEFQTAAMLRGSYTFTQQGDDLVQSFSGGEDTIDFKIPAGNKTKLDMLGDGDILATSWDNAAAPILDDLYAINAAFVELTGQGLEHVVLTSVGWGYVTSNTQVKAIAGTANSPFATLRRVGAGEFTAVLAGVPWVQFHVVDYGLEVGTTPTFTKLIEDDHAAFFPTPAPRWVQYLEGGEWVTEGPNGPKSFQHGFYPYAYPTHNPSGWSLNGVHTGIPSLKRPKGIAYGLIQY